MKKSFKILALIFVIMLSFAQVVMANNCPETESAMKRATITIFEITLSHNTLFLGFYPKNSEKKQSMEVAYPHREIYARFIGDEPTVVEFQDVQYFDDMEGECTQTQIIRKVGGVKLP